MMSVLQLRAAQSLIKQCRLIVTSPPVLHENPLGIPRHPSSRTAPQISRKTGPIEKRSLPNVKKVLAVASGKGGVGKSTIAVNLAFSLAMRSNVQRRLRVGILDLDVFGPSVPTLMGLLRAEEPRLTPSGAIIPITNHGLPTMSMGYLLPRPPTSSPGSDNSDTPVVWRGLMVQKAVQQLLFDVDWSAASGADGEGLDILVVDMPPGTGDVPLTLGQLVIVDGAVIVSTPQDVALTDVRRGIAMFRKINVPISGLLLNQSHYICPKCTTPHYLFGPPERFRSIAKQLGVNVLGELALVGGVTGGGDKGVPYILGKEDSDVGGEEWRQVMDQVAGKVWTSLYQPSM